MYCNKFSRIVHAEYFKEHYIGPFSKKQLTVSIHPFHISPISIIPKPGCLGKFRLVQKFSYPLSPSPSFLKPSINLYINAENFPTTWGKFSIIYLFTACLPPESKAATWDVTKAYCTIPLHPSQLPATVICPLDDKFINSCLVFGSTPATGAYGHLVDTGAEIFRSHDIGPLNKWANDHVLFRIHKSHLEEYNLMHTSWAKQIANSEGLKHTWCQLDFGHTCHSLEKVERSAICPLNSIHRFQVGSNQSDSVTQTGKTPIMKWETHIHTQGHRVPLQKTFTHVHLVALRPHISNWPRMNASPLQCKTLHASPSSKHHRGQTCVVDQMLKMWGCFMPHKPTTPFSWPPYILRCQHWHGHCHCHLGNSRGRYHPWGLGSGYCPGVGLDGQVTYPHLWPSNPYPWFATLWLRTQVHTTVQMEWRPHGVY